MQNSTKVAIGVVVVCAIALAVWALRPRPVPDSVQIENQIQTAVYGANQHSVGEIMSVISPNYQDAYGQVADSLRAALEGFFRQDSAIAVSVSPPVIQVNGDSATSDCTVTVKDNDPAETLDLSRPLHLRWKKEKTQVLLLFPSTVWRVVSSNAGDITGDL